MHYISERKIKVNNTFYYHALLHFLKKNSCHFSIKIINPNYHDNIFIAAKLISSYNVINKMMKAGEAITSKGLK